LRERILRDGVRGEVNLNKETQEYFNLENKMNKFMGKFYENSGCFCDWTVSDKEKDVLLIYKEKKIKVELKYRFNEFPDILIELIQDISTNNPGWFYECQADRLHYVICVDEKPEYFYDIKYKKFKSWLPEYFKKRYTGKYIISTKGYGTTLNIPIPIESIPNTFFKKNHIPKESHESDLSENSPPSANLKTSNLKNC